MFPKELNPEARLRISWKRKTYPESGSAALPCSVDFHTRLPHVHKEDISSMRTYSEHLQKSCLRGTVIWHWKFIIPCHLPACQQWQWYMPRYLRNTRLDKSLPKNLWWPQQHTCSLDMGPREKDLPSPYPTRVLSPTEVSHHSLKFCRQGF